MSSYQSRVTSLVLPNITVIGKIITCIHYWAISLHQISKVNLTHHIQTLSYPRLGENKTVG